LQVLCRHAARISEAINDFPLARQYKRSAPRLTSALPTIHPE
jgi:hypothetical protein